MKNSLILPVLFLLIFSCNEKKEKKQETNEPILKEENVTYTLDTITMNGFVVYDENIVGTRPGVVVVHEWWGLNDYPKMRARELAKLGYIAFAADIYGNGTTVDNPKDAERMAVPFYMKPEMGKARLDAAIEKLKSYKQTDPNKIAGIGYCFGGGLLLNSARLGENVNAVVSFHGSLLGTPAEKNLLKSDILVCHGAADQFVPQTEVDQFRKQMDSIGAKYTFKVYAGATHAFTNPAATEVGKKFNIPIAYNASADSASWNDMKEFFRKIFN